MNSTIIDGFQFVLEERSCNTNPRPLFLFPHTTALLESLTNQFFFDTEQHNIMPMFIRNVTRALTDSRSRFDMSPRSQLSTFREDAQAALVEFVGTTFFLLLGLGGIQAATGEVTTSGSTVEQVMYISTCMGLSLLVSAWLFFRVTGGLFNPNVSLALLLVGVIRPVRFLLYCIAQMLGAIAASALILALTPGPLSVKSVSDFISGLR